MRKTLRWAFYALLALSYVFCFLQTTMLYPSWHGTMAKLLTYLQALVYVFSLTAVVTEFVISGKGFREKLSFLVKLGVILLCACLWMNRTDNYALTALLLFAITSNWAEENRVLKLGLYLGLAIVVVLFFLSLLGILVNNRGNAFGFLYRTDYSAHLLALALLWCLLRDGRFDWLEELALVMLAAFMGYVVGGKTDFICMLVLVGVTLCRNHLPLKKMKPAGMVGALRYSYVTAAVLSFLITLTYRPLRGFWDGISGLGTIKSRLVYGTLGFEEYPVNLFGHRISEMGAGWSERGVPAYFYLDNAYVRLLLLYGALTLLVFLGLMTYAQIRLYKNKRPYAVFALAVFALSGLIEFEPVLVSYNLLALLAFCSLSPTPETVVSKKPHLLWASVALVGFVVLGIWSWSAWQVSSWRGSTPIYGATLVVPQDSGSPLRESRLEAARAYLQQHPDGVCIVAGEKDREWLVKRNTDSTCVHVLSFSGTDEMLIRANGFIQENHLPPRLTVCTFSMEQAFISRRAQQLHIPVNSLTMQCPRRQYLKHFTTQQWNTLWQKE